MIPPPITTTRARDGKPDSVDDVMARRYRPAMCPDLRTSAVEWPYLGPMGAVSVSASVLIDAPLDRVLAVLRDLPSQVEWFPGCLSSTVLDVDDAGLPQRARQVNDVKVAKDEFELDYTHSDTSMSWRLVEPSTAQRDASGSWTLTVRGAGTEATLNLAIEPSLPLPGFLVKKALGDTARGAVKALKAYCEA
jgi:hypothetical protein